MSAGVERRVFAATACLLLGLAGCGAPPAKLGEMFGSGGSAAVAAGGAPEATGSVFAPPPPSAAAGSTLTPSEPNDDLSVAKQNFRQGNYGLAERYFRRAVESGPRDAEAWLGLAASYDRLRRYDLADRAYDQLIKLAGPTPEILNNKGYSYLLRGDYARAQETLLAAQAKDPGNPYIQNNLALLAESARNRKAVR
jgi:Flp pilus assembly protein TadD